MAQRGSAPSIADDRKREKRASDAGAVADARSVAKAIANCIVRRPGKRSCRRPHILVNVG
jgi:hypothetical protein